MGGGPVTGAPFNQGRTMNNKEKNPAKADKQQQKIDSGLMSSLFPEVKNIVIDMQYSQQGLRDCVPRIVNFYPVSYAFFRVDCLNKECVDGGFDFTRILYKMVRNKSSVTKGEMNCAGNSGAPHSSITYEVSIQYNQ
jgi:hypothetical protein